ncbi:alanine dehydrogenase [Corynebacterium doosanense]|uniref:Alanine dehydrogenase n=1 Tax=Corynebacterium doosanense CAU 212 = DSM 45436 TaxID=558173 RepID=A0A097ICX8_9CORY|nr:alanine dehydrogenase [Corynebacterium doosanense]AIT59968.1 alanine dehydrogenase [Corynebacterium doosanense CAU 212 = DSM 45436]
MIIGCPREVKNNEFRVALTPAGALELAKRGHTVRVEADAGTPSGFSDEQYAETGATIVETAAEAWDADLVVKVKEPQPSEFGFIDTQILFCYLHLAAEPEVTRALLDTSVTAYAYENVTGTRGFPLLAPMSEVAGRLATQVGAYHLMGPLGGSGILMGGVPGTAPAKVAIIGGGVAGESAARMAAGLGAEVRLLDVNLDRLREISAQYGTAVQTLASNELTIAETVADADLVIGSVLIPGAAAPKLVTSEMVSTMRDGSVLVDIAIDQGGCFEGSHPTTHDDPTFEVDGKIYYCVANMPGAVPRTSTVALTNATLPFLMQLADGNPDEHLTAGLNVRDGRIVHETVARHYGS